MFLKNLTIENSANLIRQISFRKGVNLIVDETKTNDLRESGNNVGKTTVLRLIDFCFGSDGKNIYQDPEFKSKSNSQIEQFLTNENIIITLILKDDLELENSKEIKIKRNFLLGKARILEVDNEPVSAKDLQMTLKSKIFNSSIGKPTFRQIVSKNIRDEKNRLLNTLKVLHPTSKHEEYEALYLFWLGIDLNQSERKQQLSIQKKIEQNFQKRLKNTSSLSQIQQSLLLINSTIEELEKNSNNFTTNEDYQQELQNLLNIRSQINRTSSILSRLTLRKELITQSEIELKLELSQVDIDRVKTLYDEAKCLIPNIQRTYEETLSFHNSMIQSRKKYLTKEVPELDAKIMQMRNNLDNLLLQEKQISALLDRVIAIEDYQKIAVELNRAYENKGSLEEQKKSWDKTIEKLNNINIELDEIDKSIDSLDDMIQQKVSEFNRFFSVISNELYGERFVLSADKNDKGYELNIASLIGNPGTGKKKGEMAAFDLAYVQFADKSNIDCLHFILQDQIENIHDNQISNILTKVVQEINCQYVLPVLKDKLPDDVYYSEYQILTLSQDNKLFKI